MIARFDPGKASDRNHHAHRETDWKELAVVQRVTSFEVTPSTEGHGPHGAAFSVTLSHAQHFCR